MRPPMGGGGFRGRGGRDGGGRSGGRFGGGRTGGRFGGGRGYNDEPPTSVVEAGVFLHAAEGEAVTKLTNEKIPYFNTPIYLENMTPIGKVEEIFGPINESMFSIKMNNGVVATSYSPGDKFYIDPAKLLPLSRFLPQPKGQSGRGGGPGGRGGRGFTRGRGAPRGRGFGAPRGRGFGAPRGGGRGGSFRGRGRGF